MDNKKHKVLITNGRSPMTLDLVRNLGSAGHEIHVAETSFFHVCRFSNKVVRSHIIPSPRFSTELFIEAMIHIVKTNKIDLLIPAWEDALLIAQHQYRFPSFCKIFTSDFALLSKLHNKWGFTQFLGEIGIPAPESMLIESEEDLQKISLEEFALKACYSRASQKVYKLTKYDGLPKISCSKSDPWIAQKWLEGESFCTFSVCKDGKLKAHSTYPIDFVQQGKSTSLNNVQGYCLTFRSIHHEKIVQWVKDFAKKTSFTGMLAFDFIETAEGNLYAIECNPRITSGVTLFAESDNLDKAFFGEAEDKVITPGTAIQKQITIAMILYGRNSAYRGKTSQSYWKTFLQFRDIVFNRRDLKPFVIQPLLWIKYFFQSWKLGIKIPAAFTHDIDYNAEQSHPISNISRKIPRPRVKKETLSPP